MTGSSLWLLAGALAALWYAGQLTHQPVSLLRSTVKAFSTFALLVAGWSAGAPHLVLLGLAFGVLGDVFLSRDPKAGFLPGLAAFLIGHLCYLLWGFAALRAIDPPVALDASQLVDIAVFLAVAGYVLVTLWPHLGAMRRPVLVYAVASVGLGCVAVVAMDITGANLFAFGIGAFITSDVILAFQIFVMVPGSQSDRMASTTLWALYWTGQAALMVGATNWAQLLA